MGSQGVVELGIGARFAIPCADDREVACRNHGHLLDGPQQVGAGVRVAGLQGGQAQ